jgi:hypothetical protein
MKEGKTRNVTYASAKRNVELRPGTNDDTASRVSRGVSEKMGKGGVLWYGEQAQVAG